VYTPTQRDADVPTYVNATIVRVDSRAHTITFRSESGEVRLTAEGAALSRAVCARVTRCSSATAWTTGRAGRSAS
jgi:hypothetical protein